MCNFVTVLYNISIQTLKAVARGDPSVPVSRFEEPFNKFVHFARCEAAGRAGGSHRATALRVCIEMLYKTVNK